MQYSNKSWSTVRKLYSQKAIDVVSEQSCAVISSPSEANWFINLKPVLAVSIALCLAPFQSIRLILSIKDRMPPVPKPITLSKARELSSDELSQLYIDLHARASSTTNVFISLTPLATLNQRLEKLRRDDPNRHLALHGVPYVVKDNIDAPPHATTNGCPAYEFLPEKMAPAVASLEAAGAVLVGKVNMDQFATGLVGTRSPYGVVTNVHDPAYISGGSSSGSAVAVALGIAAFSLGTDTAGSGRVPAAMQGIVGLKPTKGVISTRGVAPACASLDCISIFANSVSDATIVTATMTQYDSLHPYSRPAPAEFVTGLLQAVIPTELDKEHKKFRFGIPTDESLDFAGDASAQLSFQSAVEILEIMGGEKVKLDFNIFSAVGAMLYEGPFVAERFNAVGKFIKENISGSPQAFDKTVSSIILNGEQWPAHQVFAAQEKVRVYCKQAETEIWPFIDFFVVPSVPCAITIEEVKKEPVKRNALLGKYTNFVNLMDYCAIAVPSPSPLSTHIPRGCTFIAKAFQDPTLIRLATVFEEMVSRSEAEDSALSTSGRLTEG